MNEKYLQLEQRIEALERENQMLKDYSTIAYEIERALSARGFITASDLGSGILYVSGGKVQSLGGTGVVKLTSSVPSAVAGGTRGVYVATISGGAVNNFMDVADGIVTSI